ncbi:MAG: hypothetical protein AB7K67_00975 [Hyphomicrobiaceae bacterium]
MLSTTTTIRSWPALLLAGFFAAVTGRVLLDDVIAGAPFTVTHLSSIAALVAAIGALHYTLPALRAGAIVAGVLLGVSGFAALGYVVVASGMRNAETAGAKAASAEHVNAQRAGVLKMLAEAEYMLAPCPAGAARADFGNRCGLRAAMAAECGSGKGKRCDGKAYSVRTYEAAIGGYTAELARLGPERKPFTGTQRSAEFLAALPFVTASAETMRASLDRLMPYAPVVVVELVGLGFALFAFGSRAAGGRLPAGHSPAATKESGRGRRVAEVGPSDLRTCAISQTRTTARAAGARSVSPAPTRNTTNVISFAGKRSFSGGKHPVIAALENVGGTVASNRDLARLMGVTDGEASKRVAEVAQLLETERVGKYLRISLRQSRATA